MGDDAPIDSGGSGGVETETAVTIQVASFPLANATKNAVDTYPCADPSCFWQQLQDKVNNTAARKGTCVDPDEPVKIVRVQFLPPTAPPPDAPLTQAAQGRGNRWDRLGQHLRRVPPLRPRRT